MQCAPRGVRSERIPEIKKSVPYILHASRVPFTLQGFISHMVSFYNQGIHRI